MDLPVHRSCSAYSLLEILTALVIMAMLIVFLSRTTDAATRVVRIGSCRMECDQQASIAFERMGADLGRMIKRRDADCLLYKNPPGLPSGTDDALFFYSESPAYFDAIGTTRSKKNTIALIGYRVSTPPGHSFPILERMGMGLYWDGDSKSPVFSGGLVSRETTPDNTLDEVWGGSVAQPLGTLHGHHSDGNDPFASSQANGVFHALCPDVLRLEFQFLLTDGSISNRSVVHSTSGSDNLEADGPPGPAADSSAGYSVGSRWFDIRASRGYVCECSDARQARWRVAGTHDVSALIVTLAILDSRSRGMVTSKVDLSVLADAQEGRPVSESWLAALKDQVLFARASGIPKSIVSQVRIYQRTFYLSDL